MSGMRAGCGLEYWATSPKDVTRRNPPEGFFTKNEGFKYSGVIPRSSGLRRTWSLSNSSHLAWSS